MKNARAFFIHHHFPIDLLLVLALAAGLLYAVYSSGAYRIIRFNLLYANDQINYLTTARNLLEYGRLDSNLIYIGALNQDYTKNTFYMPGYPMALAITYWFFGYGTLESQFPGMLAYVISCLLIFQLAKENFGRKAAWLSTLLFILFPLNLYFAFIVMVEMFFVAVSLLAFYLFTHLKLSQRWYLGPLLVAAAFLVRETGALLVVPMALFIIWPDWRRFWKECVAFVAITIFLLVILYLSPVTSGRISLFYSFAGLPLYDDIAENPFSWTIPGLIRLLLDRIITNIRLINNLKAEELFYFALFLISVPVSLLNLRMSKNNERFYLATVGLVVTSFTVLFTFYEITSFRGVRSLMFTMPFALITIGAMLIYLIDHLPRKLKFLPLAGEVLLLIVLVIQNLQTINIYNSSMREYIFERQSIHFIESLHHDDQRVLAAPLHLAINYTNQHYPVKLAFIPVSKRGFEALIRKYDVGTIILPSYIEENQVSVQDLEAMGFTLETISEFSETKYFILKNNED